MSWSVCSSESSPIASTHAINGVEGREIFKQFTTQLCYNRSQNASPAEVGGITIAGPSKRGPYAIG